MKLKKILFNILPVSNLPQNIRQGIIKILIETQKQAVYGVHFGRQQDPCRYIAQIYPVLFDASLIEKLETESGRRNGVSTAFWK